LYGLKPHNDWRAENLESEGRRTRFDLISPEGIRTRLFSPLPGVHNVLDTLAAAAVLDRVGVPARDLLPGLESFQGVKRRQEVRGERAGVTVIDDFAHHPTAVRHTVAAVRAAYDGRPAGRRLIAVFEPRTNTSRRKIFQKDYAEAFDPSDLILVREPPDPHKAPEGELFSAAELVRDLTGRGLEARSHPDTGRLLEDLLASVRAGDIILIMSNGGFDNLHQRLLDKLAARESATAA
jgi:UDP-N-acetylmuramate: L-alanyl-gamma-D-glutamyl-meso-diaminopimelate ligase